MFYLENKNTILKIVSCPSLVHCINTVYIDYICLCFNSSMPRRFLTLREAVEAVLQDSDTEENSTKAIDICILPPDDGRQSETEDILEDNLQPEEPGDVCGEIEVFSGEDSEPLAATATDTAAGVATSAGAKRRKRGSHPQKAKKSKVISNKWTKRETYDSIIAEGVLQAVANTNPELIVKSPMELFELIWNHEIMSLIVEQSELYARRDLNQSTFSTTDDEIRQFIGILLLTGYNCQPCEKDYWSTSCDLGCDLVTSTMSRNRFLELKRCLHLADNQQLQATKMAKVAPIYDLLNKNLLQFGIFHDQLSVDESMVPYYGHHGAKMFIRGKPIRFGFKLWMLCGVDGYPYQAAIYSGKTDRPEGVGLGEHVVLSFANLIPDTSCHKLFFDNFFSSHDLLVRLKNMGLRATGTVREGRIGDAPLKDKKSFTKKERGKFEYVGNGVVTAVRWSDNNVVTCITNFDTVTPEKAIQRNVKGKEGKSAVKQPRMIANYTSGMGGVDLMDRLLSTYRPRVKGKKWWWNLFINAVNIASVAAWRLHCSVSHPAIVKTHLQFLRELVQALTRSCSPRVRLGGPTAPTPNCVRFDGVHHYLEKTSQGRCVFCTTNTTKKCSKCDKRLHEKCFEQYHTK